MRSPALMIRSSGWCSRSHAWAVSASASTTKTAWLARTSGSGSPPNARASPSRPRPPSSAGSAEYSDTLLEPVGAGSRYTATPALSGPRSLIWPSIAPRCSPSRSSTAVDLLNSPTIPHIPWLFSVLANRLLAVPRRARRTAVIEGRRTEKLCGDPTHHGLSVSQPWPRIDRQPPLRRSHRPQRLPQPRPAQRRERLGVHAVVRRPSVGQARGVVLEADARDRLERLAQRGR